MSTSSRSKASLWFPLFIFGTLSIMLGAFSYKFHEPWRDEVQPALLAASISSFAQLLDLLQLEGHPPLLYLILKLIQSLGATPPLDLVVVSGLGYFALVFGIYLFIKRWSKRWQLACLVSLGIGLTYACVYELGVVARAYGLGVGLSLFGLSLLFEEESRGWKGAIGAIACGLAAVTSVHGAILSGSILLMAFFEALFRRKFKALAPIVLQAPFFLVTLYISLPDDRRPYFLNKTANLSIQDAVLRSYHYLCTTFVNSIWWPWPRLEPTLPRYLTCMLLAAFAISVICSFFRFNSPGWRFIAGAVVLNACLNLYASIFHYGAPGRHGLLLAIPLITFVAVEAIRASSTQKESSLRRKRVAWATISIFMGAPLLIWMAVDGIIGTRALQKDASLPFSKTKAVAQWLPPGSAIFRSSPLLSPGILYWGPQLQEPVLFSDKPQLRFNNWNTKVKMKPLQEIRNSQCQVGNGTIFEITGEGASPILAEGKPHCAQKLEIDVAGESLMSTTEESFSVFALNCHCLSVEPLFDTSRDKPPMGIRY